MPIEQKQQRHVVLKAQFPASINFFPAMTKIIESLQPKYFENWQVEAGIRFTLFDRKARSACRFNSGELFFYFNTTDDGYVFKTIEACYKEFTKHLKIKQFTRFGLRHQNFYPVDMKTNELADLMASKFHTKEKFFSEIFVRKLSDIGIIFDFDKGDFKYHYKMGPGPKKQLRILASFLFHEELMGFHFASNSELNAHIKEYPEQAIFTDIDCYVNETKSDFMALYKEMQRNLTEMRKNSIDVVLGKK